MNEENDVHLEQDENLDESVLAEESQASSLKKIKEKLKASEDKAKDYLDSWQRAQADFANLRRRDEEAKNEFLKFANQGLLEELIPILDSFKIAISEGHKEVEPIYKQFMAVLKGRGVEEVDPLGEVFDPRFHEAIRLKPVEKAEDDQKVIEVLQKGYVLAGKIIRPAKVTIGEFNN